ncbi:MAG: hypothetical protein HYY93_02020 [Planctomycetes bacterium]|nr:hypothetical protein [Planctomycetota bacterium]
MTEQSRYCACVKALEFQEVFVEASHLEKPGVTSLDLEMIHDARIQCN